MISSRLLHSRLYLGSSTYAGSYKPWSLASNLCFLRHTLLWHIYSHFLFASCLRNWYKHKFVAFDRAGPSMCVAHTNIHTDFPFSVLFIVTNPSNVIPGVQRHLAWHLYLPRGFFAHHYGFLPGLIRNVVWPDLAAGPTSENKMSCSFTHQFCLN